jgi:hypothetical protein
MLKIWCLVLTHLSAHFPLNYAYCWALKNPSWSFELSIHGINCRHYVKLKDFFKTTGRTMGVENIWQHYNMPYAI